MSNETVLLTWRATATAALIGCQAQVLTLRHTLSPEGCPMVWLDLDDEAGPNVCALIVSWAPKLGIFVEHRGPDGELTNYQLHLVGGDAWLQIDCGLEFADEDEDEDDDGNEAAAQEQATAWFDPFMAAVLHQGEPFNHANEGAIRSEVEKALLAVHPDAPHQVRILVQSHQRVGALKAALKDAHTADFLRGAARFAGQVAAAEDLSPDANMTVIREVVYRHMLREDPGCASRKAVEPIAIALAAALKQRR